MEVLLFFAAAAEYRTACAGRPAWLHYEKIGYNIPTFAAACPHPPTPESASHVTPTSTSGRVIVFVHDHDPLLNCRMRTTAFFRFVRTSWSDSFTIFFNPFAPGTSTPKVGRSKRACTRLKSCPESSMASLASEMVGPSYQAPSRECQKKTE